MKQTPVWPAYLVAAACFAIALVSSIANISLLGQVRQQQRAVDHLSARSDALARSLVSERIAIFDILDTHARRYDAGDGEVIERGTHIYLALHALPDAPRGKVYEAWTLAHGSSRAAASPTFLPDARGVALILLPVDARTIQAVLVTLEPDGGSRAPSSKPVIDVSVGSQ